MQVMDTATIESIRGLYASGLSARAVGRELNISDSTVRRYIAERVGDESSEVKGDTWTISLPKTTICTEAQLIKHCKIDLSKWEIERCIFNKWDMGYKDKHDEAHSLPLFQVKAFCRLKRNVVDAREELEDLKTLAKRISYSPFTYKKKADRSGYMLELNIPDVHFNKLAWNIETGGAAYGLSEAEEIFMRAFETLLDRSNAYTFDEIWFVVGNDLLNADNSEGQTSKGTPVSNDRRYKQAYKVVRTCIVRCIERLRAIAKVKVKVILVPGNHDRETIFHLGDSLECYFHDKQDVEIDNSPTNFKFHRFGRVMLMFTHGDKGKKVNYPLLMATQQPEMFGATEFREAHIGHWHGTEVAESHGVRIRTLPALCAADDWHADNGLVGNKRSAEAFAWNAKEGIVGTAVYSVVEP